MTRSFLVALGAMAVLLIGACAGSSTETYSAEEILEAAATVEPLQAGDGVPSDYVDDVKIWPTLCEVSQAELIDDGLRRRIWVRVANEQAVNLGVVVDITLADDTVLRSDIVDVGAAIDGVVTTNTFGTVDTVESDPSREGDDCTDEVVGVKIVEFTDPQWMDA